MTAIFFLAVASSTFATKSHSKSNKWFSYFSGGTCYVANGDTDQQYCETFFTGAQCTYQTTPIYFQDPAVLPPSCSVPLRRFN